MNETTKFLTALPTLICTLLLPATAYSRPGVVSPPPTSGPYIDTTPALLHRLADTAAASGSPHAPDSTERDAAIAAVLDVAYDFTPAAPAGALTATNIQQNLLANASADGALTITRRPAHDPAAALLGTPADTSPAPPAWTWKLQTTAVNGTPTTPASPSADGDKLTVPHGPDITEWFINRPSGIEHGFTVNSPPDTSHTLRTTTHLTTGLNPAFDAETGTFTFTTAAGKTALAYSGLLAYDATGRELPAHFGFTPDSAPATHTIDIHVDTRGAVYPVTIDPILTSGGDELTPSDNTAGSFTGIATATTDEIAVTGGPFNPGGGAAYVYEKDHGGADNWGEVKKLSHADGAQFGRSVAVAGTTVAVGSPGNNTIYIFERDHGGPANYGLADTLTPAGAAPFDNVGWHIAMNGDTLAVGADRDAAGGAVYLFQRDAADPLAWNPVGNGPLRGADTVAGDGFGQAVSLSEDTLLVGAPNKTVDTHFQAGAAYVFVRDADGNWSETQRLTHQEPAAGDQFGFAVSTAGDFLAVGAPHDDVNPNDAGSVHTYRRASALALFLFVAFVTMPVLEANALFGHTLAITWFGELFVGAHQATDGGIATGLAFLFTFSPLLLTFTFARTLKPAIGAAGQFFAYNLAVAATVLLLGSPFRNNATGSVYRLGLAAQALTFIQWLPLFFAAGVLNNADLEDGVWGMFADPNHNGVPNLIEYLLAGDPLSVGASPFALVLLATTAVLTFGIARYATGFRAQLQLAQLLAAWTVVGSGFASPLVLALLASGVQANRYRLIIPLILIATMQLRFVAIAD